MVCALYLVFVDYEIKSNCFHWNAGDRIVATKSYNLQWSNPQTVKVKLDYPVNGATGAVVSFVEILVEQVKLRENPCGYHQIQSKFDLYLQSTNLGRAFINFGGIGQRQICIIVESRETLYWKFNSQIYGKN